MAPLSILLVEDDRMLCDAVAAALRQDAWHIDTAHDAKSAAALLDGNPVVGFKIFRAKGFDETRVAEGVRQALTQLEARDSGLRFTAVSGTVDYTLEQYVGSMSMLWEGAILAVLVVWGFLRNWRATLVAAAALPSVVLFFEGTGRLEVFQRVVSGLQHGGRRVYVFVGSADGPFKPHGAGAVSSPAAPDWRGSGWLIAFMPASTRAGPQLNARRASG